MRQKQSARSAFAMFTQRLLFSAVPASHARGRLRLAAAGRAAQAAQRQQPPRAGGGGAGHRGRRGLVDRAPGNSYQQNRCALILDVFLKMCTHIRGLSPLMWLHIIKGPPLTLVHLKGPPRRRLQRLHLATRARERSGPFMLCAHIRGVFKDAHPCRMCFS